LRYSTGVSSPDYKLIKVEKRENAAFLILNRPEKKNAISPEMHLEIKDALERLAADETFRVLVLTGSGDSFCAGQDLKKFFQDNFDKPKEYERIGRINAEWGETLRMFPKPTIAMVNGWCIGAGLRIMCLCDLAIASEKAVFILSEINFGLIPAGGVARVITETVSAKDGMYMALTGDRVSAEQAAKMRLVNSAVPDDKLNDETMALVRKLSEKDPTALMMTKTMLKRVRNMEYREAVEYELLMSHRLSYLQQNKWVEHGIGELLGGKNKPTSQGK
jgi:feruloyl-CoA hydratase/lyase